MRAPLPPQLRHVVTRWWSKLIGFYVLPPALRSKSFCNGQCLFPWVIDVNLPPDLNGEQMDLTHGLNFFPTGQFSRADKGENALKDENNFQIGRCDLVVNVCFRWIILLYAGQRGHCFIIVFWLGIVLNLNRGDRFCQIVDTLHFSGQEQATIFGFHLFVHLCPINTLSNDQRQSLPSHCAKETLGPSSRPTATPTSESLSLCCCCQSFKATKPSTGSSC